MADAGSSTDLERESGWFAINSMVAVPRVANLSGVSRQTGREG
jgi:hypothetical protein